MTDFQGLGLAHPILRALEAQDYSTPTPIQSRAIPALLEGRDLLGIAQTGTGKTAAFSLPLLHRMSTAGRRARPGRPLALILSPTRELAQQIADSLGDYGRNVKLRSAVVYGGVPIRRQIDQLRRGVDILVATPGRLIDLINQNQVALGDVETFVLDEADRMLDLGFVNDVKRIARAVRADRQTVLFSATMPKSIAALAAGLLKDPVRVSVTPEATTAQRVDQSVLFVAHGDKRAVLSHLLSDPAVERVLIFTRTKHRADRVARFLGQDGVRAAAIHGNKAQNARQRALNDFKSGRVRALVATDIAARGIDVDNVSHVINFELPDVPESYVHRIGRTARAGAPGVALTLCDADEHGNLRDIQKAIRMILPVVRDHPHAQPPMAETPVRADGRKGRHGGAKPGGAPRHRRSGARRPQRVAA